MTLLFRPEHIAPILEGRKTQTRRMWPHGRRVKVGGIYQCRTQMLDEATTFARIRVVRVRQERLLEITEADAALEGYLSRLEYLSAFNRINKRTDADTGNPLVWAVEFTVIERRTA